ncbi:5'-methylthioadenosine/S-adenosylhomocysteine nucleosidase family protein [[Mycoplasma] anseris]|uniref:5'-methylthioadenosine nucleosidase n=1 Tax=[Mycoplasma] anseris TaxID=92400 RepID=A0A2Z4NDE8_9BACT|nr:hypothetical protein [[Mycoplasma] anseris]AWX69613.1 5'-methylthioadenosine nucleosidase [[Mycoplasma] anseris]
MLLFIFAEKQESEFILSHVEIKKEYLFNSQFKEFQNVLLCKKNEQLFYIAHCGVGKVNASVFLTKVLNEFKKINKVINLGPAGCIQKAEIGTPFLIDKLFYYDVDLTMLPNYKLGQLPNQIYEFKTNSKLNEMIQRKLKTIAKTNAVSADHFATIKDLELIKNNFNQVNIVDMESTSLIHCAIINNVALSIIKIVSDCLSFSNPNDYQQNKIIWQVKILEIFNLLMEEK